MAKLYPPYIEGTLPAFCLDSAGNGVMTIPFAYNKAVSKTEISDLMAIKIKTVQNDVLLGINTNLIIDHQAQEAYIPVTKYKIQGTNQKGEENETSIWITLGSYYKVQLAFIDKSGTVGYFSTVGVIKCTSEPIVSIEYLEEGSIVNNNRTEYVGIYRQGEHGDVTEKVYSSKLEIKDSNGNEVYSSGEVLHNVINNPNSYESHDIFTFNRDLDYQQVYKIKYTVITTNGLEYSSPEYLLTQQKSLEMQLKGDLVVDLNRDDGFINIRIVGGKDESGNEEIVDGMFILSREDKLNPGEWQELTRFSINHTPPTKTIFQDFTIEQGKTYTYSLQQYNNYKVYSDRKKSNSIFADFDDMFLYDGQRQLKLQFNPQVSSFKTQLNETRSDTIGSKYPFFFRNARVGYNVFPIGGLISMRIDDNEYFLNYEDILRKDFPAERHETETDKTVPVYDHIDLIGENFVSERLFKLKVLDWLNDGHVKLFRSPAEGNYLVRLMDTSLSPQTQIGRMLHNVSTTAYECDDCIWSNFIKYGIVKTVSVNEVSLSVSTIGEVSFDPNYINPETGNKKVEEFFTEKEERIDDNDTPVTVTVGKEYSNNLLPDGANTTMLRFIDFLPGTEIILGLTPNAKPED